MRWICMAVCALAALPGWSGCQRTTRPDYHASLPGYEPRQTDYRDTSELVRAIERGTFAARSGREQESVEAEVPKPVTLRFASGKALSEDEQAKLRDLAGALKADSRLRVDLVGCSDPSGAEKLNQKISQARAEAVASSLEELGVPAVRIGKVVGRGADCEVQERVVVATSHAVAAPAEAGESGSQQAS
jgi:outer membrane protein OmpA-like peptidoglycan-associated protein